MHKNTLGFFNNIFLKKNIIKSFNVDVSSLFINNAMCRELVCSSLSPLLLISNDKISL